MSALSHVAPAAARRALLSALLVASTFGVARGQTVCDQLLPIGVVPPPGGFSLGCPFRYVLKRSGGTGSGPSNYLSLAYPACANGPCVGLTDATKYVCEVRNGYSCCVSASDSISLVAGTYTGPTNQGLNLRFASDTDTIPDICHSDYVGNGARVVNVPLVHPIGAGVSRAQVSGFLRMFLTRRVAGNGDITVEFIGGPTPVWGTSWGRTKVRYR